MVFNLLHKVEDERITGVRQGAIHFSWKLYCPRILGPISSFQKLLAERYLLRNSNRTICSSETSRWPLLQKFPFRKRKGLLFPAFFYFFFLLFFFTFFFFLLFPGYFFQGGSRIFLRRGAPLRKCVDDWWLFFFFFLQNTNSIRKPQVISGLGDGSVPPVPSQ